MSKRNELPVLAVSLLITAAILGGGAWWIRDNFFDPDGPSPTVRQSDTPVKAGNILGADGTSGDSVLPDAVSSEKRKGLAALAAGNYAAAQIEFMAALQENRNDPESLIYLNNAKIGSETSHTIALSVPASTITNPAKEIMRGVAQAQSDINAAGGIDGTPVKILVIDDNGEQATAAAIAGQLVNTPAVLGVVGHYSSDTTLAAAEVYEAGKLAMISPTSTAVKIADAGDYIFRTVPSDRLAAATLARYVLNTLQTPQAAVFYTSESAYSSSVKSEFTTELLSNGGQVVADFDVSELGFSAGRAVQTAIEAGADVIMLALTTATVDTSLQIISVNQQALPVVGGDSLYDPKILDVGRANAEGLTVAVPWHILDHDQTPFVRRSRQLWGGDVNWRTVTAYDALITLTEAIKDGGPTRQGVVDALAGSSFSAEGATDVVRFLPTGDRNQPSQLVKVAPGNRSGSGYDYVPIK